MLAAFAGADLDEAAAAALALLVLEAIARAAAAFALDQRLTKRDARILVVDTVTRDGQDIELA